MRLILASASPRRAELLRAAGLDFEVDPAAVDERAFDGEPPAAYVERLAREKANMVSARHRSTPAAVLAADTIVVIDGHVLGKPVDEREAAAMLARLSGRAHDVLTGVALALANDRNCGTRGESCGIRDDLRLLTAVESTRVRFVEMTPADIQWYVASGEPAGKAGAYAIQGLASRFVDRIEGSYSNVVGLPVATVWRLLEEAGLAWTLEPGA